jgi:poly-gamma-glutamate capsule biosynthesis protein CapA/YwtB (metallophosphatase superfamily)
MIDAGADAIFGHHPHRLQPLEFYRGRPIAWSLGNFVWPRLSVPSATTAVAQVVVEPDGRIAACLLPTFIESSGHPVLQVEYTEPCSPGPAPDSSPE